MALKYLKNNKAAGVYSIAAELLKSGGPNLEHSVAIGDKHFEVVKEFVYT
jgi:hypothetical protein